MGWKPPKRREPKDTAATEKRLQKYEEVDQLSVSEILNVDGKGKHHPSWKGSFLRGAYQAGYDESKYEEWVMLELMLDFQDKDPVGFKQRVEWVMAKHRGYTDVTHPPPNDDEIWAEIEVYEKEAARMTLPSKRGHLPIFTHWDKCNKNVVAEAKQVLVDHTKNKYIYHLHRWPAIHKATQDIACNEGALSLLRIAGCFQAVMQTLRTRKNYLDSQKLVLR